jgi:serine/threonine-protein kinase
MYGANLGPLSAVLADRYRVEREIGAGGMATVFLARDTKHDRPVALKVLKPELGAVLGVERFLSEIRVTANLQHPNLLPLFDSGEANGLLFYVMPFVDGESLRARLAREKQLPIDEAIRITAAVASALDYAHRQGVIHRDLKPENILLSGNSSAGRMAVPVIADFGIALAVRNAGGNRITQTGLSLGTPHYMSPEQATGDREIDARTDLYSLGAVAYEMLTGEPPHTGSTSQAIIARVLTEKPRSIRVSRPNVPPHVERAIDQALEKLPADRWDTAQQFADALQGAAPARSSQDFADRPAPSPRRKAARAVPWILAGVSAVAASTLAIRAALTPAVPVKFTMPFDPPGDETGSALAISRDGRTIVYASRVDGTRQLFARSLGQLVARPIAGTVGGSRPTISADGRWVTFATVDGKLKKVAIDGGTAVTIADVMTPIGMAWAPNGPIVVGMPMYSRTFNGLSRVSPEADSKLEQLTRPTDAMHHEPRVLPDGQTILFIEWANRENVGVAHLSTGAFSVLDLPATAPVGVIDGTMLYIAPDNALMAVPFDVRRGRLTGPRIRVSDELVSVAAAAVADDGTLAVLRDPTDNEVVLVDSRGVVQPLLTDAGTTYGQPRFSPDGRRLLIGSLSRGRLGLATYDIALRTSSPLGRIRRSYEWASDGKTVYFPAQYAASEVLSQRSDGSDSAVALGSFADRAVHDVVMSPDGRTLLMTIGVGLGELDLMVSARGDSTLKPFAATPANELMPSFSYDGRWVAYVSDESGRDEIYVRPFPGPGGRVRISDDGGSQPVWSHIGRRLYYRSGRRLVEVSFADWQRGSEIAIAGRATLFEGSFESMPAFTSFDVSPDDKYFAMLRRAGAAKADIVVWMNWVDELRSKMR